MWMVPIDVVSQHQQVNTQSQFSARDQLRQTRDLARNIFAKEGIIVKSLKKTNSASNTVYNSSCEFPKSDYTDSLQVFTVVFGFLWQHLGLKAPSSGAFLVM